MYAMIEIVIETPPSQVHDITEINNNDNHYFLKMIIKNALISNSLVRYLRLTYGISTNFNLCVEISIPWDKEIFLTLKTSIIITVNIIYVDRAFNRINRLYISGCHWFHGVERRPTLPSVVAFHELPTSQPVRVGTASGRFSVSGLRQWQNVPCVGLRCQNPTQLPSVTRVSSVVQLWKPVLPWLVSNEMHNVCVCVCILG